MARSLTYISLSLWVV